MADHIHDIGQQIIEAAKGGTRLEVIEVNLDRISKMFANKLPDDVGFFLVLFKHGEPHANLFASDLDDGPAIEKLREVRDDMRTGALRGSWGVDYEALRESRIVRPGDV